MRPDSHAHDIGYNLQKPVRSPRAAAAFSHNDACARRSGDPFLIAAAAASMLHYYGSTLGRVFLLFTSFEVRMGDKLLRGLRRLIIITLDNGLCLGM